MRAPSLKRLVDAFPSVSTENLVAIRQIIQGNPTAWRKSTKTVDWIESCYNRPYSIEIRLHAIDCLLGNHGVEAIYNKHSCCVAEYSNSGDTYAATILFDHTTSTFRLTTMGDWIETYEKRHGELP